MHDDFLRRFVVLIHDHPVLHWDLMLEKEALLRTWRLARQPDAAGPIHAEELPEHRPAYLDYEGPVSGNRGIVRRFDRGEFTVVEESGTRLVVDLAGNVLRGRATLERGGHPAHWIFSFEFCPGALQRGP